eukprot:2339795-Prymnesium_polylepis.2
MLPFLSSHSIHMVSFCEDGGTSHFAVSRARRSPAAAAHTHTHTTPHTSAFRRHAGADKHEGPAAPRTARGSGRAQYYLRHDPVDTPPNMLAMFCPLITTQTASTSEPSSADSNSLSLAADSDSRYDSACDGRRARRPPIRSRPALVGGMEDVCGLGVPRVAWGETEMATAPATALEAWAIGGEEALRCGPRSRLVRVVAQAGLSLTATRVGRDLEARAAKLQLGTEDVGQQFCRDRFAMRVVGARGRQERLQRIEQPVHQGRDLRGAFHLEAREKGPRKILAHLLLDGGRLRNRLVQRLEGSTQLDRLDARRYRIIVVRASGARRRRVLAGHVSR